VAEDKLKKHIFELVGSGGISEEGFLDFIDGLGRIRNP
jgi:hypothetical protein